MRAKHDPNSGNTNAEGKATKRPAQKAGRRRAHLAVKFLEEEVVAHMPLYCPEDVERAGRTSILQESQSAIGEAWRLAKAKFRPHKLEEMPPELEHMPATRRQWKERQLHDGRQNGFREAFAKLAEVCVTLPDGAIPGFLEIFAALLREADLAPSCQEIRSSEVYRSYAEVWRGLIHRWEEKYRDYVFILHEELGAHIRGLSHGDGDARDRAYRIPELRERTCYFFDDDVRAALLARSRDLSRGGLEAKRRSKLIEEALKELRHPTFSEVRAQLKRRILALGEGDEFQRRCAAELRAMIKNDHLSAYSGRLKFTRG